MEIARYIEVRGSCRGIRRFLNKEKKIGEIRGKVPRLPASQPRNPRWRIGPGSSVKIPATPTASRCEARPSGRASLTV
jgi:hypothetical protein